MKPSAQDSTAGGVAEPACEPRPIRLQSLGSDPRIGEKADDRREERARQLLRVHCQGNEPDYRQGHCHTPSAGHSVGGWGWGGLSLMLEDNT